MNKSLLLLAIVALAGCGAPSAPKPVTTDQDKTLHALGLGINKSIEVFKLTPEEFDRVVEGMRAARAGTPAIKFEEYQGRSASSPAPACPPTPGRARRRTRRRSPA